MSDLNGLSTFDREVVLRYQEVSEQEWKERIDEEFKALRQQHFQDEFFDRCADVQDEHPGESLSEDEIDEIRSEIENELREEAQEAVREELLEEIREEVRSDLLVS